MAADWPDLRVVARGANHVVWRGRLGPCQTAYDLEFAYALPAPPRAPNDEHVPRVRVLAPELVRREKAPWQPIPHRFLRDERYELCVYDPAADEWSPDDLIAETTVPWTLRWLFRYEGWHATGLWHGKGRAHGPAGRFHPDSGAPLRWRDRWASTATGLVYWKTLPYPLDRRGRDQGDVPGFGFDRYREDPPSGLFGG